MSEPQIWSCSCGKVQGHLDGARASRIVCYCDSCRRFVQSLNADKILDAAGGNDLLQTAPENFRFTKGKEHLAWTKITPKGPMRWYTTCCNTPVANTLGSPKIPFLSLQTAYLKGPLHPGPIKARVNRSGATGPIEDDMGGTGGMLFDVATRIVRSRVTGGYRKNPFFDDHGAPIAPRATVPVQTSDPS